jgi:histidine decarboxylase
MTGQERRYIGFPNSRIFDHSSLGRFLRFPINNVGDPFRPNSGINTCTFEQEVIAFFFSLLNLTPDTGWGYVTNGGTEGNLFALFVARERFPTGVVYFSEDAHYSLPKIVRMLRMDYRIIPSTRRGRIDPTALKKHVEANLDRPVIINANIGTTMTGAIDDVPSILAVLDQLNVRERYVHCDAALFGCMLPFIEGAPQFDFALPIDSLSISGHKFLGSPIPSGVVLTRGKEPLEFSHGEADYVGSHDCTISGSRDGVSVLILWETVMSLGRDGLQELVRESLRLTEYALKAITSAGWDAWSNPFSSIVVFKTPGKQLVRKWQLAATGDIAHLVVLPGVTEESIDAFAADLQDQLTSEAAACL